MSGTLYFWRRDNAVLRVAPPTRGVLWDGILIIAENFPVRLLTFVEFYVCLVIMQRDAAPKKTQSAYVLLLIIWSSGYDPQAVLKYDSPK